MKGITPFIIALLWLHAIPSLVFAQAKIHGAVTDLNGSPLTGASVLLQRKADSALAKGTVTGKTGNYSFENITTGDYFISFSYTGFSSRHTGLLQVLPGSRNTDLGVEKLEPLPSALANVTVTANRPLYEQKIDRLTINVENSITAAGNTALQILERSPGVVVNRQNNTIAMLGKEGVKIMINGKLSYLPASAVLQLLDGMNAGSIDQIELITTPPANFDAEGNAGYINIVLKQNDNLGTNGSFYVTGGYGKGWVTQAGINFNHRSGKVNLYGDFSYSRVKYQHSATLYNRISNNGDIYETHNNANRTDTTRPHNARLGLDYQLTPHLIAGILLTSEGRWYTQSEHTNATFNLNGHTDTMAISSNKELNNWQDYGINLNLQQQFKKGDNLTFNATHLHDKRNQPFNYYTRYYDKSERFIYDETSWNRNLASLNFWIGAIDYSGKLSKKIILEAGVKGTLADFTNNTRFERFMQGNWMEDPFLSSTYVLKESYSAAYTSIEIAANKKTSLKAGLRYEYTNSNLGAGQTKNIVDRHYGKLFPTLFISHRLNSKSSISLSYNSRITRPSFNNLAPFTYYINKNSLLTGNPALQPATSYAVNAGYTFKKYILKVSFTKEDNTISSFQPDVDSASNKTISKPENLHNQKSVVLTLSVPVQIATWWAMQYNITGTWQQINTWYKKEPFRIEQENISVNMVQSFILPKHFSVELSGFYNSRALNGITIFKPMGSLDFGIRKKLGTRDNINFSASNLLNSMDFRGYTHLPEKNLVADIHLRFSWRTFKLTYTHSFGKEKLKASRSRTTGAEDEKDRVKYN